jgi:rSAM/selenodomain-associated transferase 2
LELLSSNLFEIFMMKLSVIIPTYNEELTIEKTLEAISRLVNVDEIIIVDGGSVDKTVEKIEKFEKLKETKLVKIEQSNRGKQLHEGTKHAVGDIFWFIHADTRPKQGSGEQIKKHMRYSEVIGGNFQIVFSGDTFAAKFMTWLYPQLLSIGLVYGDSAFFVRRETYEEVGGFREYPIFEDVDLYKRLKKRGRFVHLRMPIKTSSRRFENRSFSWTFTKWSIRQGLYWIGVSPKHLGKTYKQIR